MKLFVALLLWFVFVGFGYYFDEWQGFYIGWILFAAVYTLFESGLDETIKLIVNIAVASTLMMIGAILHAGIMILFPNFSPILLLIAITISGIKVYQLLTAKKSKGCSCKPTNNN